MKRFLCGVMGTNLEGKMTHSPIRSIRTGSPLPFVPLYGRLQVRWVAQVHRLALKRVEVLGVLGAEGESGGGEGEEHPTGDGTETRTSGGCSGR